MSQPPTKRSRIDESSDRPSPTTGVQRMPLGPVQRSSVAQTKGFGNPAARKTEQRTIQGPGTSSISNNCFFDDSSSDSEKLSSDCSSDYDLLPVNCHGLAMTYRDLLYSGTDITLAQALYGLTSLYKEANMSKTAFSDFIEEICKFLPQPTVFPKNHYKFVLQIAGRSHDGCPFYHPSENFCATCLRRYGEKEKQVCSQCSPNVVATTVRNSVESVLRHMLQKRGLAKLLEKETLIKRMDTKFENIAVGQICKNLEKKGVYDLKLVQSTSYFPYVTASAYQLWTNLLAISDIEPALQAEYIILAGVWNSPKMPNFLTFLSPFCKEMRKLDIDGFKWRHPVTKIEITSRVKMVASTMEAQVRAQALGMNSFRSDFPCTFCELDGPKILPVQIGSKKNTVSGKKALHVFPHQTEPIPMRSHQKVLEQAREVVGLKHQTDADTKDIKGVQGVSQFALLPHFDLVNSFSPDYLSSCLLGVVKTWLKQILNPKNHSKGFYVGKSETAINKKLAQIRVPLFVAKPPRDLSTLKSWKASEFRNFLFFYSLPCLQKFLKEKYLKHHGLLVESIFTLCKTEISKSEIRKAQSQLENYSSEYASLYGPTGSTFNLHVLTHLAQSVEQIGPLWAHGGFVFEKASKLIESTIHSTGPSVASEVMNTYKIYGVQHALQNEMNLKLKTAAAKRVEPLGPVITEIEDGKILDQLNIIKAVYEKSGTDVKIANRCKINGIVYASELYSRNVKKCSTFVAFLGVSDEIEYAQVFAFFYTDSIVCFIGENIALSKAVPFIASNGDEVRHIKGILKVKDGREISLASKILYPMYSVDGYLANPPNLHELV